MNETYYPASATVRKLGESISAAPLKTAKR